MPTANPSLRVLAVIASYGCKNLPFLKRVIDGYRSMPFQVDVVVVSDSTKELGDDVEVVVGLPDRNPWSLPFAHKPIMAQRVDDYDLFVYSEDDIGVDQKHLYAFLDATGCLEANEIAGFMRYEIDPAGKRVLTEPWAHYHWKPESVRRRGRLIVAEFTNEHAGFYILTRDQLRRAIDSGGFLLGPRHGRYQLPETAATDPYTVCGFRKVMCISEFDSFLVHHLPNPYVHQLDVSLDSMKEQIATLLKITEGQHPATTLCDVESTRWPGLGWAKGYYEKPSQALLDLIPPDASMVLSIGCGWGELEAILQERGAKVTAIPLDSVIGDVAARRNIEVVYGSWAACLQAVATRKFDCVVMTNLLHLNPNPAAAVADCARLVSDNGVLVLGGPNISRLPWLVKRIFNADDYGKLSDFELGGVSICSPSTLKPSITQTGLRVSRVIWLNHTLERGWLRGTNIPLGSWTAKEWLLQARRPDERANAN